MRSNLLAVALAGALLASPGFSKSANSVQPDLVKKVRHELLMLPYYNIFDNLSYRIDGGVVTLFGQVRRPVLKSDAENVVKRIEGVEQVNNQIEVLPLSTFDDRIRAAAARAIYNFGPLTRYSYGSLPPIHIIVKNGNITLEGVVANEMDKNIAGIRANGVFGAFAVTNDLRVESKT